MKKLVPILFLFTVLFFATIGSEFIKPYTSYFTQKVADKDNPFNFKNEYELLIWSNKQKETQETIKNLANLVDVIDKDAFANCIIEKNLASLEKLNLDTSKLNPIQPETVQALGTALKEYQPLMIEVQTKSVQTCTPQTEADTRSKISLSCACTGVKSISPAAKEVDMQCGDAFFHRRKGVTIDFESKELNYGGMPLALMEDKNFYYGIDSSIKYATQSKMTSEQISSAKENPQFANYHHIPNAAVKLERLTGTLEYNVFWGWGGEDNYMWILPTQLMPSQTATRQCKLAEKF